MLRTLAGFVGEWWITRPVGPEIALLPDSGWLLISNPRVSNNHLLLLCRMSTDK